MKAEESSSALEAWKERQKCRSAANIVLYSLVWFNVSTRCTLVASI